MAPTLAHFDIVSPTDLLRQLDGVSEDVARNPFDGDPMGKRRSRIRLAVDPKTVELGPRLVRRFATGTTNPASTRCPKCGFLHRAAVLGNVGRCGHCGHVWFCRQRRLLPIALRAAIARSKGSNAMEIPWDYVTFPLKAEREVQCGSVRVNVGCRLAVSSGESERVQSILAAALHTVLQGDWSFASVQRSEDTTGTEQIDATATIRVPESHTAGIVARLQAAKRPGLRLTLGQMSNRPPREEIEQTRLELRRTIYDAANIELAALNESISMPGRPWELSSIEFSEVVGDASEQQSRSPHFIGRHMRSLSGTEAGDSDSEAGEDIAVGTRLVLQASVTCRRLAIAEPLGGFFGAGSSGPAGSPRGL